MRKGKSILVLTAAFLWMGTSLSAQTEGQRPPQRERIRENIHRLRLLRMTEALDLSEAQTAVIYPAATRIENDKQAILREINSEMRRLRSLLAEADPDEDSLLARVAKIKELRQGFYAKDREFEDILEENLSPLQRAKYLFFSTEFYRGLTEGLRGRRPGGGKRPPA